MLLKLSPKVLLRCRYYYSWVLAMLMWQQNMQMHTFPKVMFQAENFTVSGYSCMPDKVGRQFQSLDHRVRVQDAGGQECLLQQSATGAHNTGMQDLPVLYATRGPGPFTCRYLLCQGCAISTEDKGELQWVQSPQHEPPTRASCTIRANVALMRLRVFRVQALCRNTLACGCLQGFRPASNSCGHLMPWPTCAWDLE